LKKKRVEDSQKMQKEEVAKILAAERTAKAQADVRSAPGATTEEGDVSSFNHIYLAQITLILPYL
jgi:hypothetical protein